ncbi:MAG: hypothetical protein JNM68_14775 [Dinghuibacter sp.]|nr:hypothetical protein [Dinghuibacter sp.]
MSKMTLIFIIYLFQPNLNIAQLQATLNDSINRYFKEAEMATANNRQLWSRNLFGPLLLVQPATRQVYANYADTAGVLKKSGNIFTGTLPNEINMANTALNWNGRRWAMVMLPLPEDDQSRISLLTHELFHLHQPALGFGSTEANNGHLDRKDGRVYLRLELEALKKSLMASGPEEQERHLFSAFVFKKYRHSLFPGADSTENMLELNEGLAEYTGFVHSTGHIKNIPNYFAKRINSFVKQGVFVRSFAYETVPVYGYLLARSNRNWNKEITPGTNLAWYMQKEWNIVLPATEIKSQALLLARRYNGPQVNREEAAKEERKKLIVARYKKRFVTQPHFSITFEQMNISFNPGNMIPIEDIGTVYPKMRITDNWGVLTVHDGALLGANWNKVSLTIPTTFGQSQVSGAGWVLELKNNYTVIKDEASGNYILVKK